MASESEILAVLELRVKPGALNAVVGIYERNGILELPRTISGYQGAELWIDEERSVLVVTSRWVDVDAYEQWLADPRRAAFGAELFAHLDTSSDPTRTTILYRPCG